MKNKEWGEDEDVKKRKRMGGNSKRKKKRIERRKNMLGIERRPTDRSFSILYTIFLYYILV